MVVSTLFGWDSISLAVFELDSVDNEGKKVDWVSKLEHALSVSFE